MTTPARRHGVPRRDWLARLAMASALGVLLASSTAMAQPTQPRSGTARVAGLVLADSTERPIAGAVVTLSQGARAQCATCS